VSRIAVVKVAVAPAPPSRTAGSLPAVVSVSPFWLKTSEKASRPAPAPPVLVTLTAASKRP
jgi:hypothetical protein